MKIMNAIKNMVRNSLLVAFMFSLITIFTPAMAVAQTSVFLDHFGGTIGGAGFCPCSGNWLIALRDKGTQMLIYIMYQPGVSTLHLDALNFPTLITTPGIEALGGLMPFAQCLIPTSNGCVPIQALAGYVILRGTIDTIRGVGTNGTPVTVAK